MSQESPSAVNLKENKFSSKRMNNETTQVIRMLHRIPERQSLVARKMLAAHSNGSRRIARNSQASVFKQNEHRSLVLDSAQLHRYENFLAQLNANTMVVLLVALAAPSPHSFWFIVRVNPSGKDSTLPKNVIRLAFEMENSAAIRFQLNREQSSTMRCRRWTKVRFRFSREKQNENKRNQIAANKPTEQLSLFF